MKSNYSFFTPSELKPEGWMLDQLRLQREGLNGNLDLVWPDIRDSKWIGGDREGWERVPYWLDGFVPLAYLLDDEDLKARAKRYVDKILEFQEPDGWICPNGDKPRERYDTWAVILICKVLTVYYDCSGDERIPNVVYRVLKNYYELLSSEKIKLDKWAKYRWFELFISLRWLRDTVGEEEWIYELGRIMIRQGMDYGTVSELWKTPINRWTYDTHIVNIAMMLKSEAEVCSLLGEEYSDLAERFYSELRAYNGTPVEILTGDECLSGISPIQGTELCSVVELMYSFERLYLATGDTKWAQRLERVAYNALPATLSDDTWTHQYVQLSNQISCVPFDGNPIFRTNGRDAHVFGLEPHFGCCTANFGQGWPKLALSAFMKNDSEVISSMLIPSSLKFEWKGTPINIRLETNYPFEKRLVYTVSAQNDTDMIFKIRIPSFAKNLKVNGKAKRKLEYLTYSGFAQGVTVIAVEFEAEPKLEKRPHGLYNVSYGSLVFSANIKAKYETVEYESYGVERKFPYCDYRISPESEWNFAFASRDLKVKNKTVTGIPFSSKQPPVTVEADMCHIDWGYADGYDNVCAKKPNSIKAQGNSFKMELYPYGCAKLRMTEMPMAKIKR